jgi:hypothetical protein
MSDSPFLAATPGKRGHVEQKTNRSECQITPEIVLPALPILAASFHSNAAGHETAKPDLPIPGESARTPCPKGYEHRFELTIEFVGFVFFAAMIQERM